MDSIEKAQNEAAHELPLVAALPFPQSLPPRLAPPPTAGGAGDVAVKWSKLEKESNAFFLLANVVGTFSRFPD